MAEATTARFFGIYTHGGHSYDGSSVAAVVKIAEQERDAVVNFAAKLKVAGVACTMVGVGSTPTCSNPPAHLDGVTEMHPGSQIVKVERSDMRHILPPSQCGVTLGCVY